MASGLLLQAQRSVTGTRGDGGRVTTITYPGDGTSAFTPGISERKSSASRMMHGDYLGSIVRQTGSAGTSQYGARYDAFGATYATSGTPWGPFGFAGEWGYQTDADSGLMLLGHRYYDSSTGRFLSRDPIKDGRNWYAYCENNPLKWVDPEGLQHGNVAGDQPATLYALYDEKGNFLKWGVTHNEDPNRRYPGIIKRGGFAQPLARGPRRTILNWERDLSETRPGPLNKEPWSGARRGKPSANRFFINPDGTVDRVVAGRVVNTYRPKGPVTRRVPIDRSRVRSPRDN